MEYVEPKIDFHQVKREMKDRMMDKQLSESIWVIVKGVKRQMSLASYFICRKDPTLFVKLPDGQKPLIDPRHTEVKTEKKVS